MVMDILKQARRKREVIHLEIGEPDLEPPPKAVEALEKAIKERKYFYTPSLGLEELRERIALFYREKYNVDVSPERIAVTPGTSGAFLVAYSVLLEAGERIAIADPSYPCYKNFAYLLNVEPEFIPVSEETNYEIRADMLTGKKVKAVHISSPSNPTGTLYSENSLKELADFCDKEGIYLISDEIYHGLVYEEREHTALEFSDKAIVVNGFSKAFCMPGFRIGWLILPPELVRKAEIVIQNVFISAPTLSQYAAVEAFDWKYLKKVKDTFARRRSLIYNGLKRLFHIVKPKGAFYLWIDVSSYTKNSTDFAFKILKEALVAVTPGEDFGKNRTDRFIRIAYTRPEKELKEGIKRIKDFLEKAR